MAPKPFGPTRRLCGEIGRTAPIGPAPRRPPMTRAKLFSPLRIGDLDLANRIGIAPMCQYSAQEGRMTDWHLLHLGRVARSGAALLAIESSAITPEGRTT